MLPARPVAAASHTRPGLRPRVVPGNPLRQALRVLVCWLGTTWSASSGGRVSGPIGFQARFTRCVHPCWLPHACWLPLPWHPRAGRAAPARMGSLPRRRSRDTAVAAMASRTLTGVYCAMRCCCAVLLCGVAAVPGPQAHALDPQPDRAWRGLPHLADLRRAVQDPRDRELGALAAQPRDHGRRTCMHACMHAMASTSVWPISVLGSTCHHGVFRAHTVTCAAEWPCLSAAGPTSADIVCGLTTCSHNPSTPRHDPPRHDPPRHDPPRHDPPHHDPSHHDPPRHTRRAVSSPWRPACRVLIALAIHCRDQFAS